MNHSSSDLYRVLIGIVVAVGLYVGLALAFPGTFSLHPRPGLVDRPPLPSADEYQTYRDSLLPEDIRDMTRETSSASAR